MRYLTKRISKEILNCLKYRQYLLLAYGARLALHRAGLRVPEDVSLIGFDDLPHSAFTLPPLTSVRQSVYEIGTSAAKAMFDLLNKVKPPARLIDAELVIRESTRIHRR